MKYLTKCSQCNGKGYIFVEEQLKEEDRFISGANTKKCSLCIGTGVALSKDREEDAHE